LLCLASSSFPSNLDHFAPSSGGSPCWRCATRRDAKTPAFAAFVRVRHRLLGLIQFSKHLRDNRSSLRLRLSRGSCSPI
jgi:hypothetical protein